MGWSLRVQKALSGPKPQLSPPAAPAGSQRGCPLTSHGHQGGTHLHGQPEWAFLTVTTPQPERPMLTPDARQVGPVCLQNRPSTGAHPAACRDPWHGHSRDTGVAVLTGGDVQGRVPVDVHGVQVAPGGQQDLGYVHAAREGGPVQANVLLLEGDTARLSMRSPSLPPSLRTAPSWSAPNTAQRLEEPRLCLDSTHSGTELIFAGQGDTRVDLKKRHI